MRGRTSSRGAVGAELQLHMVAESHPDQLSEGQRRLVFFDFDNTLTRFDSTLPFAVFLACRSRTFGRLLSAFLPFLRLRTGALSNHDFKVSFVRTFLRDRSVMEVTELCCRFFDLHLSRMVDGPVLKLLEQHLREGCEVILVSANFDFFLSPLVERWKLQGVVATETEKVNGRLTGRLCGRACFGEQKLRRVRAQFGEDRVAAAIAYADGNEDRFLLDAVREGHLLKKERRFLDRWPFTGLSPWRRSESRKTRGTADP